MTQNLTANQEDVAKSVSLAELLRNFFKNKKPDFLENPEEGLEVPLEIAKKCFAEYQSVMNKRGFVEKPQISTPGPILPQLPERKITMEEGFKGAKVIEWLNAQNAIAPHNNVTCLKMGIYTDDFFRLLSERGIEFSDAYKASKIDRITMFIVVEPLDEHGEKLVDEGKVYDFGGLKP